MATSLMDSMNLSVKGVVEIEVYEKSSVRNWFAEPFFVGHWKGFVPNHECGTFLLV